jgi:hypothetical protein
VVQRRAATAGSLCYIEVVVQALGVARHFTEIMDEREQSLQEINSILLGVGVDHVLIGGLAVGYHGRERATLDVDMLVPRRALKKLATAARSHGYPVLVTSDMIRVYPRGGSQKDEAIADLVGAESNPVLNAAFKERELATVLGHRVNIVRRGALVALKFHAAVSPTRQIEDKYQDIADIGRILAKKFSPPDEKMAHRIVAMSYPGADRDLDQLIDDMRHGRQVKF